MAMDEENLTPSQKMAAAYFQRFLKESFTDDEINTYAAAITEFKLEATEYGTVWIHATTEYTALPATNYLRSIAKEYWFVEVGKRGALTARIFPKSLEQFDGSKFMGINIKK